MFRMLSYFDLRPGVSETDYNASMQDLAKHLTELDPIKRYRCFWKTRNRYYSRYRRRKTSTVFFDDEFP